MTDLEFRGQMSRISSTFDAKFYSHERMDAIWNYVFEMEPREFKKVVDHMLANFRQSPTPKDFFDACAGYRRAKYGDQTESSPDCRDCLDVGFFRVRYHDDEKSATLMRCACPKGLAFIEMYIPTWERSMAQIFKRAPVPLEWFLPRTQVSPDEVTYKNILPLVKQWKARLQTAELHWKSLAAKTVKEVSP